MTGLVLLAGLCVPFVALAATRPLLRRLAFRSLARHPREAALVVLGGTFATVMVSAAFVVGRSFETSIRDQVVWHLGTVDETVAVADAAEWDAFERALGRLDPPAIDGVASMTTAPASARSGSGAVETVQLVELDFASVAALGSPADTGVTGTTPAPGAVVLSRAAARSLGAGVGDTVAVRMAGRQASFEVRRILPDRGVAGFAPDLGASGENAFLPPGAIAALLADGPSLPLGARPQRLGLVSNRGGVFDGVEATDEATHAIEQALHAARVDAEPQAVKRLRLDSARSTADGLGKLFFGGAIFGVLAGMLLLVSLFVNLAAERGRDLGVLRALGYRRSHVVGSFALEGWAYALAAALVGSALGIALGGLAVALGREHFGSGRALVQADLRVVADTGDFLTAAGIGVAVGVATALAASLRISRLHIVRAIRELPAARRSGPMPIALVWLGAFLAAAAGALLAYGIVAPEALAILLGGVIAAVALVPCLARVLGVRRAATLATAAGAAWGLVAIPFATTLGGNVEITLHAMAGVVTVAFVVACLSLNLDWIGRGIAAATGRGVSARVGTAYPTARAGQSGMTVGVFALVTFTVVYSLFAVDMWAEATDSVVEVGGGGFDVLVRFDPADPLGSDELREVPGVRGVAATTTRIVEFTSGAADEALPWPVTVVDEEYAAGGPSLRSRRAALRSDESAYRELIGRVGTIIPYTTTLQINGTATGAPPTPGSRYGLRDPVTGRRVEAEIVGVLPYDMANLGALVGPDTAQQLFGPNQLAPTGALVATSDGDAPRVARRIEAAFSGRAVEVDTFRDATAAIQAGAQVFMRGLQAYLAVGALAGVAGLAVVMVRATRERRREIGMLRSMGASRRTVGRAFGVEAGLLALLGIGIGVAAAAMISYSANSADAFGYRLPWSVPWVPLLVVVGGLGALTLLAALGPSRRAARVAPATALRFSD